MSCFHCCPRNVRRKANRVNPSRQLRYVAEPRALKDYDGDATTTIAEDIPEDVSTFDVSDATSLIEKSYIMIGQESMYIRKITGNTLQVTRGQDGTQITTHSQGDSVNVINSSDDELIDLDDDFGFSEYRYNFDSDGKIYSSTKGIDL